MKPSDLVFTSEDIVSLLSSDDPAAIDNHVKEVYMGADVSKYLT